MGDLISLQNSKLKKIRLTWCVILYSVRIVIFDYIKIKKNTVLQYCRIQCKLIKFWKTSFNLYSSLLYAPAPKRDDYDTRMQGERESESETEREKLRMEKTRERRKKETCFKIIADGDWRWF